MTSFEPAQPLGVDSSSVGPGPRAGFRWSRELIIYAIDLHHRRYLRMPTKREWQQAGENHPSAMTVRRVFGSWSTALGAAGFTPPGPGGARGGPRRRCLRTGRWLPIG